MRGINQPGGSNPRSPSSEQGSLHPPIHPQCTLPARQVPRKAPAGDSGSSPCPLYFYCPERCNQRTGVHENTCGSMGVPLFPSLSRFLGSGETTRILLSKNASKSTFLRHYLLLIKTLYRRRRMRRRRRRKNREEVETRKKKTAADSSYEARMHRFAH